MRKVLIAALLAAASIITANPANAAEVVNVGFTNPNGGVSTGLYSGTVKLKVTGTGFSLFSTINDAFYFFNGTRDPNFYQLNFGTSPLVGYNGGNLAAVEAQNADNFVVGGLPAFNPAHIYEFLLNTGAAVPTQLYFGVSDGIFGDNGGAFEVTIDTIDSGVPEPSTWAMFLLGFGLIGAAVRRRKVNVSYA